MLTLHYQVTLQEPAILTALEGEPNSAVSYDFVPGSVMRGALVGARQRWHGAGDLDVSDPSVGRLFFSPQTRYLNAYPVINDRRSLPVPASWRKLKYGGAENAPIEVYDLALGATEQTGKMEDLKQFVDYDGQSDRVWIYKPRRVINVHTQRARRYPSEQQVYRYDALAAGQSFAGVVMCDNADDVQELYQIMAGIGTFHLGGARSAGYGLASLDQLEIRDDWEGVHPQPVEDKEDITVTLLSDVIVRDQSGQHLPTPAALARAFASHAIHFDYGDYVGLQTTLVGGFNRKWGLPLPQTPALLRGGVFRMIGVKTGVDGFDTILRYGLGERTNEGFGEIALDWQRHSRLVADKYQPGEALVQEWAFEESRFMWQRVTARLSMTAVSTGEAASLFIDDRYRISGSISPTQLTRLRSKISDELRRFEPKMKVITDFLTGIDGKVAGKQYENARIQGQSLASWLRTPRFDFVDERRSANPRYMLQLIDAVLERAHKDRTSKPKESA